MKIKSDFVTNSSSSSFLIYGVLVLLDIPFEADCEDWIEAEKKLKDFIVYLNETLDLDAAFSWIESRKNSTAKIKNKCVVVVGFGNHSYSGDGSIVPIEDMRGLLDFAIDDSTRFDEKGVKKAIKLKLRLIEGAPHFEEFLDKNPKLRIESTMSG